MKKLLRDPLFLFLLFFFLGSISLFIFYSQTSLSAIFSKTPGSTQVAAACCTGNQWYVSPTGSPLGTALVLGAWAGSQLIVNTFQSVSGNASSESC